MTAIMLPALFAACTNDDFTEIGQDTATLNGRKVVGNVTLNVEADANTRLAYGANGYTWEDGDEIGACLMDQITSDYNTADKKWSERFDLVDYIQTNYKFTRDAEANWTTEAKMCEGNYFFVYPYDANKGVRDAYEFDATAQVLEGTDNTSLKKAYVKNNSFVGYGKVVAGDAATESVAVPMVPVFGSTGFTLKNTGTGTYKIEKIVLRGTKVIATATVNPTGCTTNTQYSTNVQSDNSTAYQTWTTWFNVAQYTSDGEEKRGSSVGLYDPAWDAYDKTAAMKDVLDYASGSETIEVTLSAGNSVATQQSINIIAMVAPQELGAATNTTEALLDIYTDKGMIKDIQLNKRYQTMDEVTNVLTDLALTSLGTGNKVEITFDDTSLDVPNELNVASSVDLAALVHWNAKKATDITATLEGDINITKAIYDELAASNIKTATLTGAHKVTIDADVPAGALDRFTFASGATVEVKGTQVLAKNNGATNITVATGATLNVTADATATIINKGALNVSAKLTNAVTNNGVAKIAANGQIVTSIANVGSASAAATIENAGTIVTLTNSNAFSSVTNDGTIVSGTNAGVITNNGTATLTSNTGTIYAKGTSATDAGDNSGGSLVITQLDERGNYKTATGQVGAIVQEIASASTTTIDKERANTIWLTGTLSVDPNKSAQGAIQDVDYSDITIYAKSAKAEISGTDGAQKFEVAALKIAAASALVINKTTVAMPNGAKVTMEGVANKKAYFTINSNAGVTVDGSAITDGDITDIDANNIFNNYSNK